MLPMGKRSTPKEPAPRPLDTGFNWIGKAQTLWSLLPGAVTAAVTGYLAFVSDLSPLQIWLTILVGFACGVVIYRMVPTGRNRVVALSLLAGLAVFSIGLSLYQMRATADAYTLRYDGTVGGSTFHAEGDRIIIDAVNVGAVFSNENNFPVWVKPVKMEVRLEGRDANNYTEPRPDDPISIAPYTAVRVDNGSIRLPEGTDSTKSLKGRAEFELAYGREPDKLEKRVAVSGLVTVVLFKKGTVHSVILQQDENTP